MSMGFSEDDMSHVTTVAGGFRAPEKEKLVTAFLRGESVADLSAFYAVTRGTVEDVLRESILGLAALNKTIYKELHPEGAVVADTQAVRDAKNDVLMAVNAVLRESNLTIERSTVEGVDDYTLTKPQCDVISPVDGKVESLTV